MAKYEIVTHQYWKYQESKTTKLSKRILKYLNKDRLGLVVHGDRFLYMDHSYSFPPPNYVYDDVIRWAHKKGWITYHDVLAKERAKK